MTQDWRKRERLWRHLKTYSRAAVQQAVTDLALPTETFRMMGIREWQWIERAVTDRFVRRPFHERTRFLFENIAPADGMLWPPWSPEVWKTLVPEDTPVYAALGEDWHTLWWCEGSFGAAASVFSLCRPGIDLVLVPQSIDWLVCVNHHDELLAVGEPVAAKVAAFEAQRRLEA